MRIKRFMAMGLAVCVIGLGSWSEAQMKSATPPPDKPRTKAEKAKAKAAKGAEAIAQAKLLVQQDPGSAEAHYELALAYADAQKLRDAFITARKSFGMGKYAPAYLLLSDLWKHFDKQGLFNVGVPLQRIQETLGEPDYKESKGGVSQWRYGTKQIGFKNNRVALWMDLRGLEQKDLHPSYKVDHKLDPAAWKLASHIISADVYLMEYVPPAESPQKYTSMMRIQLHMVYTNAEDVAKVFEMKLKGEVTGGLYKQISTSRDNVLYQWHCSSQPVLSQEAQHEVGRFVSCGDAFFNIAYVHKGPPMTDEEVQKWADQLNAMELVKAAGGVSTPETENVIKPQAE